MCPSPYLNVVSENIIKDVFPLVDQYLADALPVLYQMNMLGG
jgi:hypothetical protein